MRSDLEKIPGIKDITTDFTTNISTFKAPTPQDELKKKLDEFAKTNEHMKNWTFMEKDAAKKNEGADKTGT